MSSEAMKEVVYDLSPSAKLVFIVLDYKGELTQKQIVEESMLSPRTVRYALDKLEDAGAVEKGLCFTDGRQRLYEIQTGANTTIEEGES